MPAFSYCSLITLRQLIRNLQVWYCVYDHFDAMWSHDCELLKYDPVIGYDREKGFKRNNFSSFLVEYQTQFRLSRC